MAYRKQYSFGSLDDIEKVIKNSKRKKKPAPVVQGNNAKEFRGANATLKIDKKLLKPYIQT